jgi:hypothetical protein
MDVLMRPLKQEMAVLDQNPEKMNILSKILIKFLRLSSPPENATR